MKIPPKRTTFDTNNIHPGELINTEFDFYNVTSIRGFTSMITVVCKNTRMIWVFNTTHPNPNPNPNPNIIHFILTKLKNEQYPCKCVIVDEDRALEKSTDVTNLVVDAFNISMETTSGDE